MSAESQQNLEPVRRRTSLAAEPAAGFWILVSCTAGRGELVKTPPLVEALRLAFMDTTVGGEGRKVYCPKSGTGSLGSTHWHSAHGCVGAAFARE